jgi:hypothetical protein
MNLIADIQIIIPDSQVGKRDGKIINLAGVEQMFFTVCNQTIEAAERLIFFSQRSPGKTLVKDFIGLLIIVEESLLRLGRATGGAFKTGTGLLFVV